MKSDQLRYIERQIEAFINTRTQDGGKLNRADLTREYGFTVLTASNHIQRFMKRNPGFLGYDASGKFYYRLTA